MTPMLLLDLTKQLPDIVEAFYVPRDAPADKRHKAKTLHAQFLRRYHKNAGQVPLLQFDAAAADERGEPPFMDAAVEF